MVIRKGLFHFSRGFGFIELLIALLVIFILAFAITKSMRKNLTKGETGQAYLTIKGEFENEFNSHSGIVLKEAGLNNFVFKSNSYKGGFKFSGLKPYGTVEKLKGAEWVRLLGNVYDLRFTYYDGRGDLIIDEEASKKPDLIGRIKVSIKIHNGKEESDYYVDDGVNGADLDGDKTNGVARLKEISFIVDIE